MEGWVKDCGWKLLTDEVTRIPELNGLVIAGRRDESRPGEGLMERADLEDLLKDVDPEESILLLQHEPSDLDDLDECGVDLSVSGHTHDGQIFPGNIITRILENQSYGMKDWGEATAIVTSGVGYYGPPIRVCTISEIVVIDLV
jgi:predicted MPP superfamily phosphohydrolase